MAYVSKLLKFIKEQEASGLLSSLGIKANLSQVPILGPIVFWRYYMNEMNEIVNKFSFVGDKFMPEMLYATRIQRQCLWTNTKNKEKKLEKQIIQDIYIKKN